MSGALRGGQQDVGTCRLLGALALFAAHEEEFRVVQRVAIGVDDLHGRASLRVGGKAVVPQPEVIPWLVATENAGDVETRPAPPLASSARPS